VGGDEEKDLTGRGTAERARPRRDRCRSESHSPSRRTARESPSCDRKRNSFKPLVDPPPETEIESNGRLAPKRTRLPRRPLRRSRRPPCTPRLRYCRAHHHGPPLGRSGAGGPMSRRERSCPWPA
jgi:hypothetical protein